MSKLLELFDNQVEIRAYIVPLTYKVVYREVTFVIIGDEKREIEVSSITDINKGK